MTPHDTHATVRTLGRLLSLGMRVSTLMLAIGLVLALIRGGVAAAWLLHAGLVVLLATPVTRVAVSVLTFASQREWRYVTLTTVVLLLLITGILVAVDV
jgi:uncharacterized membrane protein